MTPPGPGASGKPELLAPAGSWEAALAAFEAGADAIYLGLQEWSARGRAKNFSLEDLRSLLPTAHAEGRRVYVAMNTLLSEEEVERALPVLWELGCLGVDAVILQDLGLWHACRSAFPELRLHASTQLAVHDSAGVRALEGMGFARVVLARECTLAEIARIRDRSTLALEVFVHGALCFSFSGLCLASSLATGRSANRGWCAQPCRWPFRRAKEAPAGHPFSCSDLCLLDRVGDLAAGGASALKIEGRLKPPEYVYGVVRAYRTVLDAPEEGRASAAAEARELLASVAGRPATTGYADRPRPGDVLAKGGRPAMGSPVGEVTAWRAGIATIRATIQLHRGDRLRVHDATGGERVSLVLREFRRSGRGTAVHLQLPCSVRVAAGDRVYRVKEARGEQLEQRLAKEAARLHAKPLGTPLDLAVGVRGQTLRFHVSCGPARSEGAVPLETHPAERRPLDETILREHLGKLGATPFRLRRLELLEPLPPVVIPPSAFKAARTAVVEALERALSAEREERRKRALVCRGRSGPLRGRERRLWLRVETPPSVEAARKLPSHRLVIALNRGTLGLAEALATLREGIAWELPLWIGEDDLPAYRRGLETLAGLGFRRVVAANLSHLPLVEGLPLEVHAGWPLYALNGWAAAGLAELGCRSFTPSPELDRSRLRALAEGGWPVPPVPLVYGRLPLFATRLAAPGALSLRSADGEELSWAEVPEAIGGGWSRVHGSRPLCWFAHLEELGSLGIEDFLVSFEGREFSETEMRAVLRAFERGAMVPEGTEGNYERGLV